jgi:hypothetical protein
MITRVTDSTPYRDGLRFYRPEPYLLVIRDTSGTLQASVISLPNRDQEYVLRKRGGIGATEVSATLEGGWNLTQFGSKTDTKIPEMITAFAGALQPQRGPGGLLTTSTPPGLYRFLFHKDSGYVIGVQWIGLNK